MRESLGLAIGAGTLAALNPCGFAMLPAYLTLFVVGNRDGGSRFTAVVRALIATAAMTGGFMAVFVTFGLVLTPVASAVTGWLPFATIAIGAAIALVGVLMLFGRAVRIGMPGTRARFDPAAGAGSMLMYGVTYAVASLGCTIGPFLAVTGTTFRAGDVVAGVASYAAYAVGMGLVVGVLAVSIALAQQSAARMLRAAAPHLGRVGGVLLIVVGLYVAWYGLYELRLESGGSLDDPLVAGAGRVQQRISNTAEALGPAVLALVLLALTGGVAISALLRRTRARRAPLAPEGSA